MSRWFRHYAGMMRDEKLVSAAVKAKQPVERVAWVWGAILESAAEINDGGRYEFDCGEAAYFLRCGDDELAIILSTLADLGRLHEDRICKWADRQYESDNSTERVRKHRASVTNRNSAVSDVVVNNECNDAETLHQRYRDNEVTPDSVYVSSSVSDKRTETEKITDEFEIWYAAYPKHIGRGAALRAYRTARKKADYLALLNAAKVAATKYSQSEQKFIPHPATWLNAERWQDEELLPLKPQEPISNGLTYVEYGTEAGDAWERDYRSRGKIPPRDKKGGWYHPSEFPHEATPSQAA